MSLLIKALQKAEQSKGAKTTEPGASYAHRDLGLELAPHHERSLPDYRDEAGLDEVTTVENRPDPESRAARNASQITASTVFRAKQTGAMTGDFKRAIWLGVGGVVFLLIVGVGFYLYLESLEQPDLVIARPAQTVPLSAAPAVSAISDTVVAETAPASQPPAAQADNAGPAPDVPAKVVEKPSSIEAQSEPPIAEKPAPATVPVAATNTASLASAVEEDAVVKVTRSRAIGAPVNNTVMAAYQAYMSGDDVTASRLYRQTLRSDPRNTDALLGLAAIAARQDRADEASAHFMRVLEIDPRNAVAQAGLITLLGSADPAASESRLKSMLAQQPEAAFLHAALGHLYAEQNQWSNAQQAYFQAYRYDADNAEYAFNLAVSLDQMGKPDLALQHYQRALDLLQKQGAAGIDRALLEARIAQLRR